MLHVQTTIYFNKVTTISSHAIVTTGTLFHALTITTTISTLTTITTLTTLITDTTVSAVNNVITSSTVTIAPIQSRLIRT